MHRRPAPGDAGREPRGQDPQVAGRRHRHRRHGRHAQGGYEGPVERDAQQGSAARFPPQRRPFPDPPRAERRHNLPALLALLLGVSILLAGTVRIFLPFAAPIVLALVATAVAYPLFTWILERVGTHRRGLASILTCAALVLLVFLPLAWIGWSIAHEAPTPSQVLQGARDVIARIEASELLAKWPWLRDLWERVKPPAAAVEPGEGTRVSLALLGDAAGWVQDNVIPLVSGAFQAFLKFCLMLFILFFFFKDGPGILLAVMKQIPLDRANQEKVVATFAEVSRSIIRGSFGTALAQGVVATAAYAIVGIPAAFWGVTTAFCALVPPLGTTLVTVPLIVYLYFNESPWKCIFLAVVAVGIGLLDNVLRPVLMRGGLHVHSIWLLLAILGGIDAFGPMGIIYGPMLLVLLGTFIALLVREGRREAPRPGSAGLPGTAGPARQA